MPRRPRRAIATAGLVGRLRQWLAAAFYRPERHYMRGGSGQRR